MEDRKPAFKVAQARYKRRPNDPDRIDDLHEVIDFHHHYCYHQDSSRKIDHRIRRIVEPGSFIGSSANHNHNHLEYTGPIFTLNDYYSGFLFFPAALSTPVQEALAYAAVRSYCEFPHVTNIHGIPPKSTEFVNRTSPSMWEIWKQQQQQQQSNGGHNSSRNMAKRKQKQKVLSNPIPYYRSFQKLSWSTMGYHYDWTERAYREQNQSPVPDELAKLGPLFACTAAHIANPHGGDHSYQATACIVNYYDEKSVMGGHRDDLEQALTKPIVSISLGRPAIFLLGGKSLDDEPVLPILLRSGDVMILGGDCRLNYHSMARLLPTHLPADQSCAPLPRSDRSTQIQLEQIFGDPNQQVPIDTEKELLNQFLSDHRVNINLRQVYD